MPASQTAASFRVPTGFKAERGPRPSLDGMQNLIAMAWDPRGRLWIAENYT